MTLVASTVEVERDGGVATLWLNRPERLNAWEATLGEHLCEALDTIAADPDTRLVVLRGRGRAFCSGADLRALDEEGGSGARRLDLEQMLHERYHPVLRRIVRLDVPTLAVVHGPAVGIGVSLAAACDLVLAGSDATFQLAFTRIGLAPDGGASALVVARAGLTKALELALTARRIDAPEALACGLVTDVVDDAELEERADELSAQLGTAPTLALAAAKRAMVDGALADLERQLSIEAGHQGRLAGTADFAEGVSAFLEKRPARFCGR
jgi:enoyl-CoA hydratase/carnithine racemase